MKSILVTAVSGTGKSTVCMALQKLGQDALDIESIYGLYELIDNKTEELLTGNLDQIHDDVDWNCKPDKLKSLIARQKSPITFYCGGMSNTEEVWNLFTEVIVLIVSDETTLQRLSTRKTGEFGDSDEKRQWVLSWKNGIEQRWLKAGAIEVSAEDDPMSVAREVINTIQ